MLEEGSETTPLPMEAAGLMKKPVIARQKSHGTIGVTNSAANIPHEAKEKGQ